VDHHGHRLGGMRHSARLHTQMHPDANKATQEFEGQATRTLLWIARCSRTGKERETARHGPLSVHWMDGRTCKPHAPHLTPQDARCRSHRSNPILRSGDAVIVSVFWLISFLISKLHERRFIARTTYAPTFTNLSTNTFYLSSVLSSCTTYKYRSSFRTIYGRSQDRDAVSFRRNVAVDVRG